ncbi:predicted protein, partial [Arabidopsis lyrata subsp. lyrata]
ECFRNFVNRTLALQCASPLKKFSLKCHYDHDSELAHVFPWVCNALDRGVVELGVSIKPRWDPVPRSETGVWQLPVNIQTHGDVFLPHALFTSKTLVKLTLGTRVAFGKLPPDLSLPALKTLFIDSIFFEYEDLCYVLLPGCPVLEELYVRHKQYIGLPFCISSRTIEKLSVQYDSDYDLDLGMSFDAPSLVFLDYSDYALSAYPQVNLKSLIEARLDIRYSKIIKRPNISVLFIGISNIETLHLSANTVDGLDSYTGDETMRPFQVKVLRVHGYGGTAKELEHLKKFIGESECGEVVLVEAVVDDAMYCKPKGFCC